MLPLHIGEDRAKDNLGKVSKKMGSVKNFLSHSLKLKFQYFLQTLHVSQQYYCNCFVRTDKNIDY